MAPARGYGGGEGLADSPAALAIPSITERKEYFVLNLLDSQKGK